MTVLELPPSSEETPTIAGVIPIADGRTMHGSRRHEGPETIRAAWQTHATTLRELGRSFPNRASSELVDRSAELEAAAYVSDNRWVADCPVCNGGIAAWDGMPDGCCYDCGTIVAVSFPRQAKAAVAVLELRPAEARHWKPELESVADLKAENAVRGFPFVDGPVEAPKHRRGNA